MADRNVPETDANAEITARVVTLVARKVGKSALAVRMEDRLLHDLGIYGEDAEELIMTIAGQFSLDASAFPFKEYFLPEAFAFWLLPGFARRKVLARMKPLTVKDLIRSAVIGKWPH